MQTDRQPDKTTDKEGERKRVRETDRQRRKRELTHRLSLRRLLKSFLVCAISASLGRGGKACGGEDRGENRKGFTLLTGMEHLYVYPDRLIRHVNSHSHTQMVLFEQSICIRNMHNVHDSAVILDIVSI